jgi:hypothetical protein
MNDRSIEPEGGGGIFPTPAIPGGTPDPVLENVPPKTLAALNRRLRADQGAGCTLCSHFHAMHSAEVYSVRIESMDEDGRLFESALFERLDPSNSSASGNGTKTDGPTSTS